MSDALVSVGDVRKVYEPTPKWMRLLVRTSTTESVVALESVSLEVHAGEICAVVGPNGAGKSTLFRILTGLTTPTSGSTRILGLDPIAEAHRVRRYIGFMPAEDRTLFLRHTCLENLYFHGRLQGMSEAALRTRAEELLRTVGLWDARDRVGFALSSGMRARLMFARALLHEPRILILDEPTGAIDPIAAFDLLELIQDVSSRYGLATLISSHRVEEIEALRDNVMLIDRGRVLYRGNLDTIRPKFERTRYLLSFATPEARDEVLATLKPGADVDVSSVGDLDLSVSSDASVGDILERLRPNTRDLRSFKETPMPLRDLLRAVIGDSSPTGVE